MNVSQIVQRIIDLSLNEDAPDTNLQTKALGWLNNAYKEAYNIAATYAWPNLAETQTVAITSGAGTLPYYPRRVFSVVDTTTSRVLKPSDILYITEIDPSLTRQGNPSRWYTTNQTAIKVHPVATTSLRVILMPQAAELTIDGAESTIKIPPHHHELLVWASLVEGIAYERGFGNDMLIQIANARKTQLMDNYMREMRESLARETQRTQLQDY